MLFADTTSYSQVQPGKLDQKTLPGPDPVSPSLVVACVTHIMLDKFEKLGQYKQLGLESPSWSIFAYHCKLMGLSFPENEELNHLYTVT